MITKEIKDGLMILRHPTGVVDVYTIEDMLRYREIVEYDLAILNADIVDIDKNILDMENSKIVAKGAIQCTWEKISGLLSVLSSSSLASLKRGVKRTMTILRKDKSKGKNGFA